MNHQLDRFPLLETNRIILRRIEKDDAPDIFTYLSDKEVMKHYGTKPFQTVDEAIRAISRYETLFNEKRGIRWGMTLKGDHKVISSCVLYNMVTEHYRTDIGFVLNRDFWGQGIA